jgi:hypothetical protein
MKRQPANDNGDQRVGDMTRSELLELMREACGQSQDSKSRADLSLRLAQIEALLGRLVEAKRANVRQGISRQRTRKQNLRDAAREQLEKHPVSERVMEEARRLLARR